MALAKDPNWQEWQEWDGHSEGVITRTDNEIILIGKNVKTVLYRGLCDTWLAHPRGAVVQTGNQLILNMQSVIFEGKIDEWASHPGGVVMKKDALYVFHAI